MHNFSYFTKVISKSPIVANVIIYNWLHVSNSIKHEKRHNDKFWNNNWNSTYDALAQNPVLKTTPYMLPQNAKSPWPLNIHGTLSKR